MVITANAPKFDKRQPSKGAYDAIVYIQDDEVIAEDSDGSELSGATVSSVINAALVEAANGVLVVSSGVFLLDSGLLIGAPVSIRGAGRRKTFFVPVNQDIDVFRTTNQTLMPSVEMRDFSIGIEIPSGHDGIVITNCSYFLADNVEVQGMTHNGISIDYGWQFRFSRCTITGNGNNGVWCGPNVENGLLFFDGVAQTSGAENIKILGGIAHNISRSHFEGGTYSIYATDVLDSQFTNNKLYAASVGGICLNESSDNCVMGNRIKATSGAGDGIVLIDSGASSVIGNDVLVPGIAFSESWAEYQGTINNIEGNEFYGTVASVSIDANSASNRIVNNGCNGRPIIVLSDSNNILLNNGFPSNASLNVAYNRILENRGFLTLNRGSSTGTGSEQTIAHSLAVIPTGCKAWITYLVGARYITEMIPFDATNIYPTVDNGVAFTWGIGGA
jgi:parallel beta-helix repeat protein